MKHLLLIISFLFLIESSTFSQEKIELLNGYEYVYVHKTKYENGTYDRWGIRQIILKYLEKSNFNIIDEITLNNLTKNDPCKIIHCTIDHTDNRYSFDSDFVTVKFINCKNETVYEGQGGTGSMVLSYRAGFQNAAKRAMSDFKYYKFKYDKDESIESNFPSIQITAETEESLKRYYSTNSLDIIEGFYKSYQVKHLQYYKIGIKRKDDKYIAIIIDAKQDNIWNAGEIIAIFEPTSMKGIYSVKWYMNNKTSYETFAMMESEAIISIKFENPQTGEKSYEKLLKTYPSAEGNISFNKVQKSSGSGFLLTSNGIIATNAHVVKNAETLKVQLSSEIGNIEYSAKVLLLDNNNDVALVKIDDDNFKGMSKIPYSIVEKAEVGEKAFTIGYPLNNVMGTNFKVTDGIISSASGVDDDIRYYQISVPLQPGNSGGPLFNIAGDVIGITSSRLNSKAVGTEIENVNYAIKISYLLNLYNMLPNSEQLNITPSQSPKELQDQIKTLRNYVCLIKIN